MKMTPLLLLSVVVPLILSHFSKEWQLSYTQYACPILFSDAIKINWKKILKKNRDFWKKLSKK